MSARVIALSLSLVAGCAPTRTPAPPRSFARDAPPLIVPPLPPEAPPLVEETPAPKHQIELRIFKNAPTACDPLRTHVPCIYRGEQWCMFHDGEHADEPIACEAPNVPALLHRVRVCLDIENIAAKTRVAIYDEDAVEARVLDARKSRRLRLCATADRMWRIEIGGTKGTLDWTKTTCHTLDARTMRLRLGCDEPFNGIPIEDEL